MERGDVFHVDLDPIQGREQAGARYVVIVSPKAFNVLGTPLVCPITQGGNFARHAGFAVPLSGAFRTKAGRIASTCSAAVPPGVSMIRLGNSLVATTAITFTTSGWVGAGQ